MNELEMLLKKVGAVGIGFNRRRYGTKTYTWPHLQFPDGRFEEFAGDPWPSVIVPRRELVEALQIYLTPRVIRARSPHIQVDDERNEAILRDRLVAWDQTQGPRVGDYLRFSDGVYHRFGHDWKEWGDGLQTNKSNGSFHLSDGFVSFSGGLYPIVPRERIMPTDDIKMGEVWFEHHGYLCADCAVYAMVPCRVFVTDLPSPS